MEDLLTGTGVHRGKFFFTKFLSIHRTVAFVT